MFRREEWQWTFLSFQSTEDGKPIQEWYDRLPRDHKVEVASLLQYVQKLTRSAWGRPFFDPLEGEAGISEIIVPDIRDERGVAYYRIYGYRGPEQQQYTFLHATNKKVRNDEHGKAIARRRLEQLKRRDATVHEFDFEGHSVVEIKERSERQN